VAFIVSRYIVKDGHRVYLQDFGSPSDLESAEAKLAQVRKTFECSRFEFDVREVGDKPAPTPAQARHAPEESGLIGISAIFANYRK
jgi:hypothetical protein